MIPIPTGLTLGDIGKALKWLAAILLAIGAYVLWSSRASLAQELQRSEADKQHLVQALADTHAAYARAEVARAELAKQQREARAKLEKANAALDQALREAPDWSDVPLPAAVLRSLQLQPANARSP